MNTNSASYYELLNFGLGEKKLQALIDKLQARKYNVLDVSGFAFDPEIQLDYTYEQLEADLGISTLPVYMDVDSPALDKKISEFKIGSNKVPTQKHRYSLNTKMLRERLIMIQRFGSAALNADTRNALLGMLFDSTDKLLSGNRNALTHQRMRIVSTGQFSLTSENNPRGIKNITFDFGIPNSNKETLADGARWWTSSTHNTTTEGGDSDPLGYLKAKVKVWKHSGFPAGHIEMSDSLYSDMLTHSKVVEAIGYALVPTASSSTVATRYGSYVTDEQKGEIISKIIGMPIVVRDSISSVESFDSTAHALKVSTIENFDVANVAIVPDGQIGTIKSVQQIVFNGDPGAQYAWFDGGRTLVSTRYNSETREMFVESEMAQLCVPNVTRYMCVYSVTA